MSEAREVTTWDAATRDAVARVRSACAAGDGRDPLDEAAHLLLKHHGLEGSRLWLVSDSGFALLHQGNLDLAVAPTARGCGFGTQLAEAAAAYTQTAWSHGDHPAAAVLAQRHGFVRSRELLLMRRPTTDLPPLDSTTTIRSFRPGDEDEIVRVNAAAFADHPEQGAMDRAGLAERMAEPWFDPAGLLLAVDGDRTLGFHWTKRHDASHGEVYVVAIDPDAQGRGLGRTLTLAGLHHLADTAEVVLYVESDNRPALQVYEGLGFVHGETHVQYRRP